MLSVTLRHRFPGFTLDAGFEAPAGVTALFGRSGSGKTSIVKAVAGLLRPDAGRIVADGRVLLDTAARIEVPVHRRRVGFVFQDARLFPHLTVRQNLAYGRRFAPRGGGGIGFDATVGMLGIGHLLARRPGALSGGERSRVGIGRALLAHPRLLILDEPMAALDAARRREILPYLERVRDHAGLPILYISHDLAEVARLATTVVLVDAGRVVRAGPVGQVLADPSAAAALDRHEAGAALPARLLGVEADGLLRLAVDGGELLVPAARPPEAADLRVRVRAQDVILSLDRPQRSSALNILPAQVTEVLEDGGTCLVQLRLGAGALLLAQVTRRSARALDLRPGVACFATVKSVALVE